LLSVGAPARRLLALDFAFLVNAAQEELRWSTALASWYSFDVELSPVRLICERIRRARGSYCGLLLCVDEFSG